MESSEKRESKDAVVMFGGRRGGAGTGKSGIETKICEICELCNKRELGRPRSPPHSERERAQSRKIWTSLASPHSHERIDGRKGSEVTKFAEIEMNRAEVSEGDGAKTGEGSEGYDKFIEGAEMKREII